MSRSTTLHTLLAIACLPPRVADVTVTSDGHYLARVAGDCGFNLFLGRPNPRPLASTTAMVWRIFRSLTGSERRQLVRLARARNVNLRDFLK